MSATKKHATDEAEIRALIDNRVRAIRQSDIDALMSNHADNLIAFDLLQPLQYVGAGAVRTRAEAWLTTFEGPIDYAIRDVSVTTGGDVAFCHGISRVSATTTEGQKIIMSWRTTICFKRTKGEWQITHEHNSVPFDIATGKAALDLAS